MNSVRASESADWLSYDPIAEIYNRLLVPIFFARPSGDLVDALNLAAGDRVLDVGTGPGVTAVLAAHAVGTQGLVVGIDPAETMLHVARRRGLSQVVVGGLPHLPFPDATFDAVMASFVLPNIPDYRAGLADMIRVLKPGGSIGVTTWGDAENEYSQLWKEVSGSFVSLEQLREAKNREIPWQEYFTQGDDLKRALEQAELGAVLVSERVYRMSMRQDEYVVARQSLAEGRLLRHLMGETKWEDFCPAVAERFRKQYEHGVNYDRSAYFGIAKKPHY